MWACERRRFPGKIFGTEVCRSRRTSGRHIGNTTRQRDHALSTVFSKKRSSSTSGGARHACFFVVARPFPWEQLSIILLPSRYQRARLPLREEQGPKLPDAQWLCKKDSGYRGIWYWNEKVDSEYVYKYSGGLGTYCAPPLSVCYLCSGSG